MLSHVLLHTRKRKRMHNHADTHEDTIMLSHVTLHTPMNLAANVQSEDTTSRVARTDFQKFPYVAQGSFARFR